MKYVILGNYGNNTIALMQWAVAQQLTETTVVSVDTGWGGSNWQKRISIGESLATKFGFTPIRLKSLVPFAGLTKDRGQFPSQKYQWCASMLKGLPINDWLDNNDLAGSATILLGRRQDESRAQANLEEWVEKSEFHGGRRIWYPLYNKTRQYRDELILAAGFDVLAHRSLECEPCIYSTQADFTRMDHQDIKKTTKLEKVLGKSMFSLAELKGDHDLQDVVTWAKAQDDNLTCDDSIKQANPCGFPWACGE